MEEGETIRPLFGRTNHVTEITDRPAKKPDSVLEDSVENTKTQIDLFENLPGYSGVATCTRNLN